MEEDMTDFQYRQIVRLLLEILKGSKDLQEAIGKLENLLKED
jgi:hypothetical protein